LWLFSAFLTFLHGLTTKTFVLWCVVVSSFPCMRVRFYKRLDALGMLLGAFRRFCVACEEHAGRVIAASAYGTAA